MYTKLIVFSCFLSFFGLTQETEEEEDDYNIIYYVMDNQKKKMEEIIPSEENIELDTLTKLMYNPIVNLEVLDSINSFRETKNIPPIVFDYDKEYSKQLQTFSYYSLDISKIEKSQVLLEVLEDPNPQCNCVESIVENILDDSLEFVFGKKVYTLKDVLLEKNIKRISIEYYQVVRSNDREGHEDHIIVTIKRRYQLISRTFEVI
jgi:hypothetical protein